MEVGVVLSILLCMQGAIWAKPTWGVWWDWDPRLTTTAVLVFAFAGILALRRFVDDPVRRGRLVGGGGDRRLRGRAHRLLLGEVVELAAPAPVHPGDRLQGLPLAAAHQRLRHPVPDVGASSRCGRSLAALRLEGELAPPLPRAGGQGRGSQAPRVR